jgi:hypothetical protein
MASAVLRDEKPPLEVNRSDLRQNQSKWLKQARGGRVLLIKANEVEEEKVVLDRQDYEALRTQIATLLENLEIAMDRKLFNQILATADTLEENLRLGNLHSLEDAFSEE